MVSYADVCVFYQHLTKNPLRLSMDESRDSRRFNEEIENAVALGHAPNSFPCYDDQYHIDFWLSQVELAFVQFPVPEEDKCDSVTSLFSKDVVKAYNAMQSSRILRGEMYIKDWHTLKGILRCVFLPLEQLHNTIVYLPSPTVSDLSWELLLPSSSSSCSSKIYEKHERDVLKEKIDAAQHKLALATKEVQDLLVQCSTILSPAHSSTMYPSPCTTLACFP